MLSLCCDNENHVIVAVNIGIVVAGVMVVMVVVVVEVVVVVMAMVAVAQDRTASVRAHESLSIHIIECAVCFPDLN